MNREVYYKGMHLGSMSFDSKQGTFGLYIFRLHKEGVPHKTSGKTPFKSFYRQTEDQVHNAVQKYMNKQTPEQIKRLIELNDWEEVSHSPWLSLPEKEPEKKKEPSNWRPPLWD